jgi:hypothetical protein
VGDNTLLLDSSIKRQFVAVEEKDGNIPAIGVFNAWPYIEIRSQDLITHVVAFTKSSA